MTLASVAGSIRALMISSNPPRSKNADVSLDEGMRALGPSSSER
jgi:hypothetical protein